MAETYGLHDHSPYFVDMFSGGVYRVSRSSRREILRIYRLDCRRLLSVTRYARSTRFCDASSRDLDAHPGFSSPLGTPQTNSTLDHSDLVVRLGDRCPGLSDALQVVSAGSKARAIAGSARLMSVREILRTGTI